MSAKYVLEFGVRAGQIRDNAVLPSGKLGSQLAADLIRVFANDSLGDGAQTKHWRLLKGIDRKTWTSETHFVALSRLPNTLGAATARFWRKSERGDCEFMLNQVITWR